MGNSSNKQGNADPSAKNQSLAPNLAILEQLAAAASKHAGGRNKPLEIPTDTIRIIVTGDEKDEIADDIERLLESERVRQEMLAKRAVPETEYSPISAAEHPEGSAEDKIQTDINSSPSYIQDKPEEPNSSSEFIPEAIVELPAGSSTEALTSLAESDQEVATENSEPVAQMDREPVAEVDREPATAFAEPSALTEPSGFTEPAGETDKEVLASALAEPATLTETAGFTETAGETDKEVLALAQVEPATLTETAGFTEPAGETDKEVLASALVEPAALTEPTGETDKEVLASAFAEPAALPGPIGETDKEELATALAEPARSTEPAGEADRNELSSAFAETTDEELDATEPKLEPAAKSEIDSSSDEKPGSTGFVLLRESKPWERIEAQEKSDNVIETGTQDFNSAEFKVDDKFPTLPSAQEEEAAFEQLAAEERERRTAPAELSAEDIERLKRLQVSEPPASETEIDQRRKLQTTTSSLKVSIHKSQVEGEAESAKSRKILIIIGAVAVCLFGILAQSFLHFESSHPVNADKSSSSEVPANQPAIEKSKSSSGSQVKSSSGDQVTPSNGVTRVATQPPASQSQESGTDSNEAPYVLPPGQTSHGSGQTTSHSLSQSHSASPAYNPPITRQPPAPLAFAYEKIHLSMLISKAKKLGIDTSQYSAVLIGIQNDSHANKHQGELAAKMKALSVELEALIASREPPKTETCYIGMDIGLPSEMPKEGADQEGYMSTKISSSNPLIIKGLQDSVLNSGASLKKGDRIISIDGVGVDGLSLYEIQNKLSGTKGTEVKIQFKSAEDDSVDTVKLIRNNKTRFQQH